MSAEDKRLIWWASSRKDLQRMPRAVQRTIGYALRVAQGGSHAEYAWRMTGNLRDVIEVITDDDAGKRTYRLFYTTAIGEAVYVLDVIQKKSKKGRATPQADLDRITKRLKAAREHHGTQEQQA